MFNKWKAKLLTKWAKELGLVLVKIVKLEGVEYIVSPDGTYRKLARRDNKCNVPT